MLYILYWILFWRLGFKLSPIKFEKAIKFDPKVYDYHDKKYGETWNIYEIITKFSKSRSDDNDTWIKFLLLVLIYVVVKL